MQGPNTCAWGSQLMKSQAGSQALGNGSILLLCECVQRLPLRSRLHVNSMVEV